MNRLHRCCIFLFAIALAAFALPSVAQPAKIFGLTMSPSTATAGASVTMTATFANLTPNGNSTIKSVILAVPAGLTINSFATPQGGSAVQSGQSISVSSMPGIGNGGSWQMTVNVTFPASATCTQYTWSAQAFTGNAFGGQPFALQTQLSSLGTAVASACKYSLTMAPTTALAVGTSQSLTATFANSPANGASFSSLTLAAPSGLTITAVTPPASGTAVIGGGGTSVTVSNITAVAPGSSFTLALTVNIACGATSGNWGSTVWSGASLSGFQFLLDAGSSSLATNVTGSCALQFYSPPKNATLDPHTHLASVTSVANNPAGTPVQVALTDGNTVVTSFNGTVTLAKAAGSGSGNLGGTLSATAVAGVASFSPLTLDHDGIYALTASASGFAPVISPNFTIFDGVLPCGGTLDPQFTNPGSVAANAPGYAAGSRGQYNKDGSTCVLVDYTFTNTILANNTVSLIWDVGTQPYAAFSYTMNWAPVPVDTLPPTAGWTARRPSVAWLTDLSGNPIYVPGLACFSENLPAPYGSLAANIDSVQTSITVNATATLPSGPFPAVIGTERMQVTNVSGSTWTVVRGTGNLGLDAAAHSANAPVMSTPLPIIPPDGAFVPPYVQGTQAHMCIADHEWISAGLDANGNPLVQYSTSVIDIGDGFVKLP